MTVHAWTYGQREVNGVEGKRFEQIIVTVESSIAEVTLDRPERHNALGSRIVGELGEALEEIEGSGEIRALVLTGAGDKAFCSGVDLKERAEMDADGRWTHNRALGAFVGHLARLQVPTIAALNGLAFGGGLEIVLACDFRITAEGARFSLPEVGIGIVPDEGEGADLDWQEDRRRGSAGYGSREQGRSAKLPHGRGAVSGPRDRRQQPAGARLRQGCGGSRPGDYDRAGAAIRDSRHPCHSFFRRLQDRPRRFRRETDASVSAANLSTHNLRHFADG